MHPASSLLLVWLVARGVPSGFGASPCPLTHVHLTHPGLEVTLHSAPPPGGSAAAENPPVVFRALPPTYPGGGFAPVFLVDGREGRQLRRHAPRGNENATEPVFFVLPLPDEEALGRVLGRWNVTATRPGGSKAWFGWEFAGTGNQVSGRFEQSTDYRFAFITDGQLEDSRLRFRVEYVQDRFLLVGTLATTTNLAQGTWRREDDAESGAWTAERAHVPTLAPPASQAVPLLEWHHPGRREYRYTLAGAPAPAAADGWRPAPRPLGRVWAPEPGH